MSTSGKLLPAGRDPPRDHTERGVGEVGESRHPAEEQLQALLDAWPDATIVVSQDCVVRLVNEHAIELFGYPREALIGDRLERLIPERFRRRHLEHQRTYFANPRPRPMGSGLEITGLTHDGREVLLDVSLSPVEIGGRTVAVAVVRDISERQRAEQALQASERRFREFMEDAQLICVTLDRAGRIVFANAYLASMTGWPRDQIEGKDWFETFIPTANRDRIREVFDQSLARGELAVPADFENPILTRSGEERLIAWNNVLVHDATGRVIGATCVGHCITEQRRAEQALLAAKAEAERANAFKSRFLAATSHDLRQPLQTLRLLQGVLARTVSEAGSRQVVNDLGTTIAAMAETLDTLLDIDQLESGGIEPQRAAVPVNAILARLDSEFRPVAQAKGLRLGAVPSSAIIRTDPRLLDRLLENLVANAIKYTEDGRVLLGCRRRGSKLAIQVWDTGIGIPKDKLGQIFEDYVQVENPALERRRGLGLGLALAQRIADLLGHRLEVRSLEGQGSMFGVEVPVVPPAPGERWPRVDRRGLHRGHEVAGVEILLVEDDDPVRESLRTFLELDGYAVVPTSTGDEAIALVEAGKVSPQLLIADRNLPGTLNGPELHRTVASRLTEPLPGIILSGDVSAEANGEIAGPGVQQLRKPVHPEHLSALIRRMLPGTRGILESDAPDRSTIVEPGAPRSTPRQEARVFVIDDDPAVGRALRALLEDAGYPVEVFPAARAFLRAYRPKPPECLLVDVTMPGMSGLELLERLKAQGFDVPVVVITGRQEIGVAVQAMRAGAVDFLEKPVSSDQLLDALGRALECDRQSTGVASERVEAERRIARLTPREREVMALLAEGLANKQVAARLKISPRTVENHRARVMEKLGVHSLAEIVRLAILARVSRLGSANLPDADLAHE